MAEHYSPSRKPFSINSLTSMFRKHSYEFWWCIFRNRPLRSDRIRTIDRLTKVDHPVGRTSNFKLEKSFKTQKFLLIYPCVRCGFIAEDDNVCSGSNWYWSVVCTKLGQFFWPFRFGHFFSGPFWRHWSGHYIAPLKFFLSGQEKRFTVTNQWSKWPINGQNKWKMTY